MPFNKQVCDDCRNRHYPTLASDDSGGSLWRKEMYELCWYPRTMWTKTIIVPFNAIHEAPEPKWRGSPCEGTVHCPNPVLAKYSKLCEDIGKLGIKKLGKERHLFAPWKNEFTSTMPVNWDGLPPLFCPYAELHRNVPRTDQVDIWFHTLEEGCSCDRCYRAQAVFYAREKEVRIMQELISYNIEY